ncbi:MAG: methylated-DNA--[protein]-cysteine S-methyltransferase [Deltaproteobacteria bacterium]|nr:methylated-DNA--[protein]-cysteine S-methyltransferase [Deltaproteobacteria bacterium]
MSSRSTSFRRARLASPIGALSLVWDDDDVLRALDFEDHEARLQRLLGRHYGETALAEATAPWGLVEPLAAFFAGDLGAIEGLRVATNGTSFQRRVWEALREIPAGRTRSYGELAAAIGAPSASRAVGVANGANPIAIVVPCHRVIGADGTLTGYGGGIARKRWLLDHERSAGT